MLSRFDCTFFWQYSQKVCRFVRCRACSRLGKPQKPLPSPSKEDVPTAERRAFTDVCSRAGACQLSDLGLAAMPVTADNRVVDWGSPVIAAWRTSEADALAALEQFLQAGAGRAVLPVAR